MVRPEDFWVESDGDDMAPAIMRAASSRPHGALVSIGRSLSYGPLSERTQITAYMVPEAGFGAVVDLDACEYRCKRTVELPASTTLRGIGSGGAGWCSGTFLSFPMGCPGILIKGGWTLLENFGMGSNPALGWMVLRDGQTILVDTPLPTDRVAIGDGVRMLGVATVRDVWLRSFTGRGIYVFGDIATGGGNCSGWIIERCRIDNAGSHGVEVRGGDANAGYGSMVSTTTCAGYGVFEHGFMTNTWVSPMAHQNRLGAIRVEGVGHTVINSYAERDQPPSFVGPSCLAIGGLWGQQVLEIERDGVLMAINDNALIVSDIVKRGRPFWGDGAYVSAGNYGVTFGPSAVFVGPGGGQLRLGGLQNNCVLELGKSADDPYPIRLEYIPTAPPSWHSNQFGDGWILQQGGIPGTESVGISVSTDSKIGARGTVVLPRLKL